GPDHRGVVRDRDPRWLAVADPDALAHVHLRRVLRPLADAHHRGRVAVGVGRVPLSERVRRVLPLAERARRLPGPAGYGAHRGHRDRRRHVALPAKRRVMSELAIRVGGLTKRFDGKTAVDAVTLSIGRGSIYGLIGPNGAGKTTTFSMLAGYLQPSEGTI